jgi:hypothetical protein
MFMGIACTLPQYMGLPDTYNTVATGSGNLDLMVCWFGSRASQFSLFFGGEGACIPTRRLVRNRGRLVIRRAHCLC